MIHQNVYLSDGHVKITLRWEVRIRVSKSRSIKSLVSQEVALRQFQKGLDTQ